MVTPNRGFLPHQESVREVAVRTGRRRLLPGGGVTCGTHGLWVRSLRPTLDGGSMRGAPDIFHGAREDLVSIRTTGDR